MLAIPNGAKPLDIFASWKFPGSVAGLKLPSNTSTVAHRKLVAYRNTPAVFVPVASPLYTAFSPSVQFLVAFGSSSAVPGMPSPRFQADIVPSSVSKMKRAGAEFLRVKAKELLATIPVGAEVPPDGEGIVTAKAGSAPPNPLPSPL